MKQIPLTQGYNASVDDEDYERLSVYKWHYSDGYAMRRAPKVDGIQGKMILMHREILNTPAHLFTDHRDGNGLNNQKYNIRAATKVENGFNRSKNKNSTTGFKGVTFNRANGNFRARINIKGESIEVGSFPTALEADKAYKQKAMELQGDFAHGSA